MQIEPRVFNRRTKEMVYLPVLKAGSGGVFATAEKFQIEPLLPEDPIMLKTSMQDVSGKFLYEGDIVECGIVADYGLVKDKGAVVWRADMGRFTINIQTAYGGKTNFDVTEVKCIGNIYENDNIINEVQAYAKTEIKKE